MQKKYGNKYDCTPSQSHTATTNIQNTSCVCVCVYVAMLIYTVSFFDQQWQTGTGRPH